MSTPSTLSGTARDRQGWALTPVRADPLRQQVFEIIRDAVFTGKIRPGETLRELPLAKSMGVSQSTVREALTQLEHVGLVVRQPNRGTTVAELSAKEMQERLMVRLSLEELALAEAARRATDEDLAELDSLSQAIAAAIASNLHFELGQADLAFHRRIWQVADNSILYRTLDIITTPLFALLGVWQTMNSVDPHSTQPHEDIVAALRTRDASAAREAIRTHILRSYSRILGSAG